MKKSLLTIILLLFMLNSHSIARADDSLPQAIEKNRHEISSNNSPKNDSKSKCLLIYSDKKFIVKDGGAKCDIRYSPCSTFKIAISLMGYDSGFLINENEPLLPFREGYVDTLDVWRKKHTPISWIKDSCIWYSQMITRSIGYDKFLEYLQKFDYGNKNFEQNNRKENKRDTINESWISSSLKISPYEQIFFIKNMLENKFNLANNSLKYTKQILYIGELKNSWKLYGKTGSCDFEGQDSQPMQSGWFVGWVEKNNRKIIFANYLEDIEEKDYFNSKIAKENLLEKINEILAKQK